MSGCYPTSKIRVTKTCYAYATEFCGLMDLSASISRLVCQVQLIWPFQYLQRLDKVSDAGGK